MGYYVLILPIKLSWKEACAMNVNVGDTLVMKKNHPCGCNRFLVLRSGMDFKLRCENCGHEVMVARSKAEKNIRQIIPGDNETK